MQGGQKPMARVAQAHRFEVWALIWAHTCFFRYRVGFGSVDPVFILVCNGWSETAVSCQAIGGFAMV